MDWTDLFYFLLAAVIFYGARSCIGGWNEEVTSLRQTKILQGIAAIGIAFHHMAQKTCAPWHERRFIVHGLDFFVPIGFLLVGVFLFCSGLGLYRSLKTKPNYLKGFCRRRILPIVIAFYLSEIIYTIVRLAVGERMTARDILWYLSGLHMANFNAWYAIVIPFLYLVFWMAFRFCRREGTAIAWVTLFCLAYTALGAYLGHPDDWWMRGEWWYNSIILFPLGLLFGKYEQPVLAFFKKGWWFWLAASFAAMIGLFRLSVLAKDFWWGYYDNLYDRMRVWHSLGTAVMEWLACIGTVWFCFVLMMKVKLGNRVLAFFGLVTLEFYLMHGLFVELFGFNFADAAKSAYYIRNVPLYILAVLACSIPAALLFRWAWKALVRLTAPRTPAPAAPEEKPAAE